MSSLVELSVQTKSYTQPHVQDLILRHKEAVSDYPDVVREATALCAAALQGSDGPHRFTPGILTLLAKDRLGGRAAAALAQGTEEGATAESQGPQLDDLVDCCCHLLKL